MISLLLYPISTSEIHLSELDESPILLEGKTIAQPLINLGYHYFYHKTKITLASLINNLNINNDFYYVLNPYEIHIQNYTDTIISMSHSYLNITSENLFIKSPDFFKIWEILFMFDFLVTSTTNTCILNDNGEVLQSYLLFNQKITQDFNINKLSLDILNTIKYDMNKINTIYNEYNKKYPKLISQVDKLKNSYDLIIANGRHDLDIRDMFEEQKSYKLLIEEVLLIIDNQKTGGHCILRIYDSFTIVNVKILYILSSFYESVFVYKPKFSRNTDSEKYIICKNFKSSSGITKTMKLYVSKLKKHIEQVSELVFDIFPTLIIPNYWYNNIKFINTKLSNLLQININEIILFIKSNNYFGDVYHKHRESQIEAIKYWGSIFFPPSYNLYKQNIETLLSKYNLELEKCKIEFNKFNSNFIQ